MRQKKFALIGGDMRSISLRDILKNEGYEVKTFGLGAGGALSLDESLYGSDVVIGPIPFTNDMKNLNTPLSEQTIDINVFLKALPENSIFICGRLNNETIKMCRHYETHVFDLQEREDFCVLNAIPTAEGAIQIAMNETAHTINSSNILVTGYGRIGKAITHMLNGIGANVYVASKNFEDASYARYLGFRHVELKKLKETVNKMDVIVNTIPSLVLNSEVLPFVNSESLIIDLASKPGGVDYEMAKKLGLKVIWALSLPGKVAPRTSAQIIRDTIFNILYEMEAL